MKTPKRKFTDFYQCPKCGAYVLSKNNPLDTVVQTACPECGTKVFVLLEEDLHAFTARCIRKNREARLKHALREMKWQIELEKAKMKGYMRACVTLKRLLNAELKVAATYRKAVITSGTYGHDIEGS